LLSATQRVVLIDDGIAKLQRNDLNARVAVIIPCLNEEPTIGQVVADFSKALPGAEICVFDNDSTDRTADIARQTGATVFHSPIRGKGNVIRHVQMIVDADYYVFVDGDGTYSAEAAPQLLEKLQTNNANMLVATRLVNFKGGSFRRFHHWGNHVVSRVVSGLFAARLTDVLSGYRIITRDMLRLIRLRASGFEVETEMTLQALAKHFKIVEVPVKYGSRPGGSHSKLSTWGDGLVILKCFLLIFKDYKPLLFFSSVATILALLSLLSGLGPIVEFYQTGLVNQVPRAVLAAGLGVLATISLAVGLILDTIAKYHEETVEFWKRQYNELDTFKSLPGRQHDRE
jgi:glycosyltransferase involved in cell wall biosynthesis